MGMDVFGLNPKNEKGEYFRNNVWWWRPLWMFCCEVGEEVINQELVEAGHFNDGAGLDDDGSKTLARILMEKLESGVVAEAEEEFKRISESAPRVKCDWCNNTGIRTDEVGISMGMHDKALSAEQAARLGRDFGWCNGCDGEGTQRHPMSSYGFSVENVREFAEFLDSCGGFEIL